MPSISCLTAALAFASTALANPVQLDKLEKRSTFSVEQVKHSTYLKNGPAQIAKTFRKYGKTVPDHILAAADNAASVSAAAVTGTVPANPSDSYDSSYLSPVTIAGKTVHLDFDTGSSDLWVFSSLQASTQLAGHDYYTADASKKLSGYTWKISYGDGSGAAGTVYADKVVVGGVTATSQAVEAATSVSSTFSQDTDTDGLLGLAFSSINTVQPVQQKTWFDTVKSQLALPVFSVYLKYHAAGSYDFGLIDSSKYTGAITYVNVDSSQGFWGFSATAYSVGTTTTTRSIAGILDTGTTLIYVDTAVVAAYYAKVTGSKNDSTQGGYTFPCSATLPDFSITVGGVKQVVPGRFINYAPVSSTVCFGGIQANTGIGFNIFGDIFLKSKYIVHERGTGTPRLGFAQQAGI
ncbi:Asp-domain-containing protein [Dothidotthia symphoricarpi CBS 119687]|uniref:Asp-domain-containing protein n=1 Tax=Dothidotthia symphoricarpi CBS 119687 TaxID=1392245 RepID=A0A6A6A0P0_9PLEO|nr:Asp-domain-containing protein [Dothidotthia symphoricarpi CBS 119687]KAF2124713.1 Asp-domain-containing protein [Dothidotthia symphoricarpi CBS 119687]